MSRIKFLNILENIFQPSVGQAMREDLIGASKKTTVLAAETSLILDFTTHRFHEVQLGSANLTALDAGIVNGKNSLKPGEVVFLKIVQDSAVARTVAWGVGIITDVTVSVGLGAVDLLVGVFDGTNIIFGATAQTAV